MSRMKNIRAPGFGQIREVCIGNHFIPVHRIAVLDADGTRLEPIKNVQSAETESK